MAIIKQAKQITVTVNNAYNLKIGGKMEKIANKINVEAISSDLTLTSNKKIVSNGNKR
ncbi:hypothetical protein SAMN02927921_03456 [Sinomicrobium oceani]|uniref:Uncharacterized protein n=1 Tax=Sinomicrobium oceani TaxID=1150368 RepID=A0A1K1REI7_9FLAO|nr:hypothetical protein [Sinomicrobium oceani]SFW70361.1 hypothetical protein SAMN02927921_03456 [Sinomicrobium oceani]